MRRALGVLLGFSFSLLGTSVQAQNRSTRHALSAEDLFKKVSPSVFVVLALDASNHPIEQGSAVVTSSAEGAPEPNGWTLVKPAPESANTARFSKPACLLITNYHVIKDGVSFEVLQGSGKWPATLVATNPDDDVAELRVEKLKAAAVPLRQFSSLAIGEHVYAIGAPEGLELTLSEGLVSSLRHSGDDRVIQTTAAISPGSSGGGLFDTSGQLVGITVAYLKEGQNLNFALPTDSISRVRSATQWAELGSKAYEDGRRYLELGNYDLESKSYKEAVHDYRQAVRLSPENEEYWDGLGDAASQEADALDFSSSPQADVDSALKEALNAYRKALQLNNDDEHAWWALGTMPSLLASDQVTAIRNVLRLDTKNLDAWTSLGTDYCMLAQADNALAALATARALAKPRDGDVQVNLAIAYAECPLLEPTPNSHSPEFLAQSLECAQSAVELQPNDTAAWEALGMVYDDMKDRAGVMKVYEKLKTLDPKSANEFFQQYVLPDQH